MKCNAVTGALAHCEKQKANAQANLESMVDRERPEKYRAGLIASGFICSKSTALRKCVVDRGFDPKELESGSASSSTKPTGGPSDKTAQ